MSTVLDNQSAVVVGASSGMGRAVVVALAKAGIRVMAAARRQQRLEQLKDALAEDGCEIEIRVVDAACGEDVESLVADAVGEFGRIDLLVYAAGINIPDRRLEVLEPDAWRNMIDVNLTGAFLCTKSVVPAMRAGNGGLIVYLSSAAVQTPDVSGVAYQSSKHGLTGLAHGARVEEKENGIRTTVIYPGLCDTEILNQRPTPTPQEILDKALAPEDVADAVLFLAGLDARACVPELQLAPSRL